MIYPLAILILSNFHRLLYLIFIIRIQRKSYTYGIVHLSYLDVIAVHYSRSNATRFLVSV